MACLEMDAGLDMAPSARGHHSPRRLSRKTSPNAPDEAATARPRLKSEINLTRELIDFDLIKGYVARYTGLPLLSFPLLV